MEMELTFKDSGDLKIFRSGVLNPGQTLRYGGVSGWRGRLSDDGPTLDGRTGVPMLTVKAPSLWVARLRGQTGERNWGKQSVSQWVRARCDEVGVKHAVQDGLGSKEFVREKPEGDRRESTWDVMTSMASELNCWLFDTGDRIVFGKPSWVASRSAARVGFRYDGPGDFTDGFDGKYRFSGHTPEDQEFQVGCLTPDADALRPGDRLDVSGILGRANGQWVISEVSIPLHRSEAVRLTARRPRL
ncbi:hypothetical protein [Nesterenkonia flava]|uniref:Uncharacterized protein n=1 Tax=Nesterenkonia flava TaxID=469799 RepID=A0ABU1FT40_9MICC|nr:hypothetical protein [Nesterenkonia flava]MDR5711397.1 hypothetical protein [Nesterenkonia flava]